jgi:DNA-binding NarL/FixJ family response regulator
VAPGDARTLLSMKVLVVEDSTAVRRRLASRLRELPGVELVAEATDGSGALWYARTLAPDVVLLDLSLPGPSGIEVLTRIKNGTNPPVVIVLTNNANEPYRVACLGRGADYFFDKSKQFDEMVDLLSHLCNPRKERS